MKFQMFSKNNLDKSTSPYLLQHKHNPIHWQEYSTKVIEHAKEYDLPILISIGYSTCHWCHVMANDTFSNVEIADYMNKNYVNIKVDREQRPDIDSYAMSFIQEAYGQGGWPLNVIFTPNLEPFFAGTYIASTPKYSMPGFLEVATQVKEFYEDNKDTITAYIPRTFSDNIIESPDFEIYKNQIDSENWGNKANQKFPPHCTLLYLLSNPHVEHDIEIQNYLKNTLDKMASSGLHDQIGGGFYRYCVDQQWHIPHFEKMLYDQAMMLISYSLGYKKFEDPQYLEIIKQIIFSLDDTFRIDDLYMSGHDADTDHEEGTTYLWSSDEFSDIEKYTPIEFEGKYHITGFIGDKELKTKLYETRKLRPQPDVDTKIITSINALLGVAFCFVEKYTDLKTDVEKLYRSLLSQSNRHSDTQKEYFLEDAASIFLLQTFLFERKLVNTTTLDAQFQNLQRFNTKDGWVENPGEDFHQVMAPNFDHPIPSTLSLLNWALLRYKIIKEEELPDLDYKMPINFDAHNYVALFEREHKLYKVSNMPTKKDLLSLYIEDDSNTMCYKGACRPI